MVSCGDRTSRVARQLQAKNHPRRRPLWLGAPQPGSSTPFHTRPSNFPSSHSTHTKQNLQKLNKL